MLFYSCCCYISDKLPISQIWSSHCLIVNCIKIATRNCSSFSKEEDSFNNYKDITVILFFDFLKTDYVAVAMTLAKLWWKEGLHNKCQQFTPGLDGSEWKFQQSLEWKQAEEKEQPLVLSLNLHHRKPLGAICAPREKRWKRRLHPVPTGTKELAVSLAPSLPEDSMWLTWLSYGSHLDEESCCGS